MKNPKLIRSLFTLQDTTRHSRSIYRVQAGLTASMPLRTTLPNNCSIILDNKQPQTCRSNLRRVRVLTDRELPLDGREQQYPILPVRSDPACHTWCNLAQRNAHDGGSRFGASLRLVIAEACSKALSASKHSR